ncbi:hypothetical protein GQ457_01G023050 [Hibiscus cannabinus]
MLMMNLSSCQAHSSISTVFMAEALAVLHGLQFTLNLSFTRVILESDLRTIIQKLQSGEDDHSCVSSTIWYIIYLSKYFMDCRFSFTPRGGNRVVYALAKLGLSSAEDCFRMEDVPGKDRNAKHKYLKVEDKFKNKLFEKKVYKKTKLKIIIGSGGQLPLTWLRPWSLIDGH